MYKDEQFERNPYLYMYASLQWFIDSYNELINTVNTWKNISLLIVVRP